MEIFFRSASLVGNLVSKIMMFFWIFWSILMSVSLGVIHGTGTSLLNPEGEKISDPFSWFNKEMIYIIGYMMIVRYLFQKIPILNIRSFLLTPLKKSKIIRYAMHQTIFSIFNLIAFFYLIPFSIMLNLDPDTGYFNSSNLLMWNLSIILIVYFTNFLNILLNKKDKLVVIFGVALTLIKILEYNNLLDISFYTESIFYSLYETPTLVIIPLVLLIYIYYYVFNFYRKNLSIDTGLSMKVKDAKMTNYQWLDRFGSAAIFLKNDLRLITRAKRARSTTIMGILFVFYGFIFMAFDDLYGETMEFFGLFFSTAGFMFTFAVWYQAGIVNIIL